MSRVVPCRVKAPFATTLTVSPSYLVISFDFDTRFEFLGMGNVLGGFGEAPDGAQSSAGHDEAEARRYADSAERDEHEHDRQPQTMPEGCDGNVKRA